MKTTLTIAFILITSKCLYAQVTYKFDTTANVYGCSNILLQKISKDRQYELLIQISQIDSLPKSKEFDLTLYSKFLTVYLNRYPKGNNYINHICNDVMIINTKTYKPNKYRAKKGTVLISNWDDEFIISLLIKNVTLIDDLNKEIKLVSEQFTNLKVRWEGG